MINIFDSTISEEDILEAANFKDALQKVVKSKRWSMATLAKIMGYTPKHFYEVINNKTDMNFKFLRRLAYATGYNCLFWAKLYLDTYPDY